MRMRRPYDPEIIGINLTGTPIYTRFGHALIFFTRVILHYNFTRI
jgi:hypothetical protein